MKKVKSLQSLILTIAILILSIPIASFSASAESNTYGCFDGVSSTFASGWAWTSSTPNTPIPVHVNIYDSSNNFVSRVITTADIYRQDLYDAGLGNGYHGFYCNIDWASIGVGNYNVRAYAINNITDPLLTNQFQFTVHQSTGAVDGITSSGLSGWIWNSTFPNTSIQAHIYIYKADGTQCYFTALQANNYREDLYNLGYGNGYHGFSCSIPWDSLPEEQLTVNVYSVDGTNTNPCIRSSIYDNRMPISLVGMTDDKGYGFHTWINYDTVQSANNIGCTAVNTYSGANNSGIASLIHNSSYFAISTHGSQYGIMCNYNNNFSDLDISYLDNYPSGYFNRTRCVLLNACNTGYGGTPTSDNFVNALYNKGVHTVVGFQSGISYFSIDGTTTVVGDEGSELFARKFTYNLGQGCNVMGAYGFSLWNVYNKNNSFCGLDSVYIAGDQYQIVKH